MLYALFIIILIIFTYLLHNYYLHNLNKRLKEHFIFAIKIELKTGIPKKLYILPFGEDYTLVCNLGDVHEIGYERSGPKKTALLSKPLLSGHAKIKYFFLVCAYENEPSNISEKPIINYKTGNTRVVTISDSSHSDIAKSNHLQIKHIASDTIYSQFNMDTQTNANKTYSDLTGQSKTDIDSLLVTITSNKNKAKIFNTLIKSIQINLNTDRMETLVIMIEIAKPDFTYNNYTFEIIKQ